MAAIGILLLLGSCALTRNLLQEGDVAEVGSEVMPAAVGNIDVVAVGGAAAATADAVRPLTEEGEYYLGRAVAARILGQYSLLDAPRLVRYVNLVGATVALHSDRPVTFGGYHFGILDSVEVNAFAAPGGIILITSALLGTLASEDQLAAVLAHEVAHVVGRHGPTAIHPSRTLTLARHVGDQVVSEYSPDALRELVAAFDGSITDVFEAVVVTGYVRSQEYAADLNAREYLARAGYDPRALGDYLVSILHSQTTSGGGSLASHGSPEDRLFEVQAFLPDTQMDPQALNVRTARFRRALWGE